LKSNDKTNKIANKQTNNPPKTFRTLNVDRKGKEKLATKKITEIMARNIPDLMNINNKFNEFDVGQSQRSIPKYIIFKPLKAKEEILKATREK
jgi:hypothetical protein